MKRVLGLDLGTNSIGWALIEVDDNGKPICILGMGSRIIPMGTDKQEYEKGVGITKNATRREKRTTRKGNKRYKLRRNKLLYILHELGMLPDQFQFKNGLPEPTKLQKLELKKISKNTKQLDALGLYELKVNALENPIELKEFGKILYQFNQLRGYSGSNNEDERKKKSKDEGDDNEKKEWQEEELEIRITRKKDDSITYKFALPQKSNWRKNMELSEKILKEENLFISQLHLRDLQQNKWVKIGNRVFLRKRYKEEFDKIWETQENSHDILKKCPQETMERIVNYIFPGTSESQQNLRKIAIEKGLKYIIKEQVIYYQRALKPQTELISNCRFEKSEKVIAISHPLFQEFRCWKQINSLYITIKKLEGNKYQYQNRYLTTEEKQKIYDKMQIQKEVGFTAVVKILNQDKSKGKLDKEQKDYFLNGLNEKAKLKGCDTVLSIKEILGDYYDEFIKKDDKLVEKIWAVIFDVKNHDGSEYDVESIRVSTINEVLKNYTDEETSTEFALKFAQNIKFTRKYASLSEKAIQNVLPLMKPNPQNASESIKTKFGNIKHLVETGEIIGNSDYNLEDYVIDFVKENPNILQEGGLMEYLAISLVYGKHTDETIQAQIKNYHDIKYEERNLRNPIVEQLANETMQVIKAIWKQNHFNPEELEIRVELARDLKNSAADREKIYKGQLKSKKTNDRIKEQLAKEKILITEENILKYRLYEQQKYSPYSGQQLTISGFNSYEIDHIIPKSRYYDDSFSNKVLVEHDLNDEKSNRTAWEYISAQNSKYKILSIEEFVQYVNDNFYGKKKKNLLAEKIPTNPVERQLKDTQYISVAVKNELAKIVGSENVKTSTGEVTDFLRSRWGLRKLFMELTENRFKQMELWDLDENGNPKTKWINRYIDENGKDQYEIKNWSKRYDHRHHSIDALVVALTTQSHIQRLNNLNKYYQDELTARKDEFNIEIKDCENILEAFFNLEGYRRQEILEKIESSRKFEIPFDNLIVQVKEHLLTMLVSHKHKEKLLFSNDKFDKNTPDKQLKKQLKIKAELHKATYYGKLNGRDTKIMDISKLSAKDIEKIIDPVLKNEIDEHRKKKDYDTITRAFTGEGLKAFNESRYQRKQPTKLKPPVYKVKVWYSNKEIVESTLQRLYDNNDKQSVITGDNYLFLVMLKKLKDREERVFTVASLYDSVTIANKTMKNNDCDFKKKIIEEKRLELKSQIIKEFEKTQTELIEKIENAKGKKRETLKYKLQENKEDYDYFIDETKEPKLIPLFTFQQNELAYLPMNINDSVLDFSSDEFNDWIKVKENKMVFCKRIYKVVKIDNPGLCHFIPNTYANHISVAKDLSKEEMDKLINEQEGKDKKKISKKDLNFVEFGSYGNCSPYEVGETFVNYLKNGSKIKPMRVQDSCIKIQIDWLGNIIKIGVGL